MYLSFNEKYWAIDIEGDGLPSKVVWCLCAVNVMTNEEVTLTDHEAIQEWVEARRKEGCKFIGHNIIGYDAPTLNRVCGTKLTITSLIDTLVLSQLYNPSLSGGHSLEEWGNRLRYAKMAFSDWSRLSDEMITYCLQDSRLCKKIFLTLIKRMRREGFSEVGLEIEHRAWSLIKKQQEVGFPFNIQEAHILYARLRDLETEIEGKINEYWPPKLEVVASYKNAFKKDGTPSAQYLRHSEVFESVRLRDDGGYDALDFVRFNVGSPPQRIEKLLELGWEPLPNERTPTGKPQPTSKGRLVPSLQKFVEESEHLGPALIAQWIEINARGNMINTWIEAYNADTGRIHGSLWLANTLRYRHSNPNTANIPAVRIDKSDNPIRGLDGVFTYEARDLWTTSDPVQRRLVGVDAKGIQLRVLAHYLNNPEFTEAVLAGDPHSFNQQVGGFATRAIAKTFIYAFLLGAGDEKIGQIIGGSPRDGKEVKQRFIGNFKGLGALLNKLENQINRTGRIVLCDGTPLIVTAPHTRLGYLLQGDESRIMKKSLIEVSKEVIRRKLDVVKVGDIHDEWQNDVLLAHVEEFSSDVCPTKFRETGEFFKYRVPIECDSKIGLTWAETH